MSKNSFNRLYALSPNDFLVITPQLPTLILLYLFQVLVENLNCKHKIQGESPGALLREPQPLLVTSEIKLVDPHDNNSCDIIWSYTEDGNRVRVSTRTGRILPIPSQAMETIDYKSADTYLENKDKDTPKALVEEVTFQPKLATFEMDIMEKMNIKEDRVPKKTFWY